MYTERFTKAFDRLMSLEGYYSDEAGDPGGRTIWGLCERDHPQLFEGGGIPTLDQAREIYHAKYWKTFRLDSLNSERLAFEVFEAGVNCGMGNAVKWLQAAYNRLQMACGDAERLLPDGLLGPLTVTRVNQFCMRPSGEMALYRLCNWYQGQHYLELSHLGKFLIGWFGKRLD